MSYIDAMRKIQELKNKPTVVAQENLCPHPGCGRLATTSYGQDPLTCYAHSRYGREQLTAEDAARSKAAREAALARHPGLKAAISAMRKP